MEFIFLEIRPVYCTVYVYMRLLGLHSFAKKNPPCAGTICYGSILQLHVVSLVLCTLWLVSHSLLYLYCTNTNTGMSYQGEPWLFSAIRSFRKGHERLKQRVHTAWRYPLPKWGRVVMGGVYFTIPVVGGYYVMQWAISISHETIGEHGELLDEKKIQGIGDKRINTTTGTMEKVGGGGAGGWGGGVKLAVSDEKTQMQNKAMLEAFFREQQKRERNRKKLESLLNNSNNETEP